MSRFQEAHGDPVEAMCLPAVSEDDSTSSDNNDVRANKRCSRARSFFYHYMVDKVQFPFLRHFAHAILAFEQMVLNNSLILFAFNDAPDACSFNAVRAVFGEWDKIPDQLKQPFFIEFLRVRFDTLNARGKASIRFAREFVMQLYDVTIDGGFACLLDDIAIVTAGAKKVGTLVQHTLLATPLGFAASAVHVSVTDLGNVSNDALVDLLVDLSYHQGMSITTIASAYSGYVVVTCEMQVGPHQYYVELTAHTADLSLFYCSGFINSARGTVLTFLPYNSKLREIAARLYDTLSCGTKILADSL